MTATAPVRRTIEVPQRVWEPRRKQEPQPEVPSPAQPEKKPVKVAASGAYSS